nr:MAG TPA: hypothetical protein [Caudoviricetes sp.]
MLPNLHHRRLKNRFYFPKSYLSLDLMGLDSNLPNSNLCHHHHH